LTGLKKQTVLNTIVITLAGKWGKDDEEAFLNATRSLETIDEEIWK